MAPSMGIGDPNGDLGSTVTASSTVSNETSGFSLTDDHLAGNRVVTVTSATNTGIVVPAGLTNSEPVTIIQNGTAPAVFSPAVGVTINSDSGFLGTAGQYQSVTLIPTGPDTYTLIGNLAFVNTPPVAVDDTATTPEVTAVNIDVLDNDTDVDLDTLSVTLASALNGSVVIEVDDTITYTPNVAFTGDDTISYTVSDGTDTDTGEVVVTVTAAPSIAQIVGVTGHYTPASDSVPGGLDVTYTAAPLGTAQVGRILYIVCPFFDGSTTDSTPSAVTVGGNNATLVSSAHLTGTTACGISIWKYQDDGALGANADITAVHATSRTSRSITVVEANVLNDTLVDSVGDSNLTGSIATGNLTTAAATFLLYASITQNGTQSAAPAPFTDGAYDYDENTTEWVHIGWDNSPSGAVESVGMPTGSGARSAYTAIAVN